MRRIFLFSFLLYFFSTCVIKAQNQLIQFDSKEIRYEGRILFEKEAAVLSWSGSSISIAFEGTQIDAYLQDTDSANYYNVVVDEQVVKKIHTNLQKTKYELVKGLSQGVHILKLFKRTEYDKGVTKFYGFELPKDSKLAQLPEPKKRKIEFYGNSITCGYAIEDSKTDSYFGFFENNYLSYSALTARHFDAQYSCIAKSGIGILLSWFPTIMPEVYDRLNPNDVNSKWDFSKFTPDVVVVNLFQNDSWLVKLKNHEEFVHRFGKQAPNQEQIVSAYKNFISKLRYNYPNATIICCLGAMDATKTGSKWPTFIKKAVSELNDAKIVTNFFPFMNKKGHPKVQDQKKMADNLIQFIDKNVKW